MGEGDGVEDALDDPQLIDRGELHRRRAPPLAAVAAAEVGLLLAEAGGLIDQPFPPHASAQGEAHGGGGGINLGIEEALLGVPALDALELEAAAHAQVGIGHRRAALRLARGGWQVGEALAPGIEQLGEQLFHVDLAAALVLAAALHHPGRVRLDEGFALAALGAAHLLQVRAALFGFEVADQSRHDVVAQPVIHVRCLLYGFSAGK